MSAYLSIIEQPNNKFRFRYESEKRHGSLTGSTAQTSPTVRLCNFAGEATIRCSLFQVPRPGHEVPAPHSHSLITRSGDVMIVSPANDYTAQFRGMGIMRPLQPSVALELLQKITLRAEFRMGRPSTALEKERFKLEVMREATGMNLNVVALGFEAFQQRNGEWIEVCEPVFSVPISADKDLKIMRLSTTVSSPVGNADLFLFVGKVSKNDIKVRFYETNCHGQTVWEDEGRFTEADVHYQYAIALKTPPYRDINIDKSVDVFIQLFRPSDQSCSDPWRFRYERSRSRINLGNTSTDTAEYFQLQSDGSQPSTSYTATQSGGFTSTPSSTLNSEEILNSVLLNTVDSTIALITQQNEQLDSLIRLDSAELIEMCNPLLDDFDNLTTDLVPVAQARIAPPSVMSGRFLIQMLKKIWPVVVSKSDTDTELSKKRDFLQDIFKQAYYNGESLLHMAMRSDEPRFMEKIWQIIVKFELYELLCLTNDKYETCLHVAAALEKPNEIRNLLRHGVDINDVDRKGDTALHVAVAENRVKCVETLSQETPTGAGATSKIDLSILNDNGYTSLHLAIKNHNLTLVKMMKDKAGASYVKLFETVETKHGNNALHIAVDSGASNVVKFILDNRCVDVNATNLSGHTALVLARAVKSAEIVQSLMDHNAEALSEEDEDNTSSASTDSRASLDSNKSSTFVGRKSERMDVSTARPHRRGQLDDVCLTQLCEIFNVNGKWQRVANHLGYQLHIPSWAGKRNPTKTMFVFSEALKLPKEDIIKAFQDLNETAAIRCMEEWKQRNEL